MSPSDSFPVLSIARGSFQTMLRRVVLAAKPRLGGVRLQNRSRGKEKFNPEIELLACKCALWF